MSTPNAPYGAGDTQPWAGEQRRPEAYLPPQQQAVGLPPGFPLVVKTKPSVMRIAFGVFLGLVMFSVIWVIVSILLLGLFASVVENAFDEIDSSTNSTTDGQLQELEDLLNDN